MTALARPPARRRARRTGGRDEAAAASADTVLRLAVLLQAGIAPPRAWRYLGDAGDPVATRVSARVGEGMEPSAAIAAEGDGWHEVAAAWSVATTVGAPLAESLRAMAAALQDAGATRDEVRVALAEPAGTARLMAWMPLVAVAMGVALGFDTLHVLFTDPIGIACLIGGVALILCARRWTARLVRRAEPPTAIPGSHAELTAIALSGGVSLSRAETIVRDAGGGTPDPETTGILELSRSAGVPAVELLRAAGALARHQARTDGRVRAAALSSRLLLPLGVCTLPAFLLLGVAPMLLSVLATTTLRL